MNNYYFPNWWLAIVHLASRDSTARWSWPNSVFNSLVWVLPFVFYIFGLILSQSIFLLGFLSCLQLWTTNLEKGTKKHLEPQVYQFFSCLYSPLFSLFQIILQGQYWKSMGILTSLSFPCLWWYCFSLFSMYLKYIWWYWLWVFHIAFIMLRYAPSRSTLSRSFILKTCGILWKTFSVFIQIIIWFLFRSPLCVIYSLTCVCWNIYVFQGR